MEPTNTLGLPSYIYQLLVSKSVEKDQILEWNVSGKNGVTELSLKWIMKGSRSEMYDSEGNRKYKSPGHVRRDMNRKKIHNVKVNSKCVSTADDSICGNMNMYSEYDKTKAAPISGVRPWCLEDNRHDYIGPQCVRMENTVTGDNVTMMMDINNDFYETPLCDKGAMSEIGTNDSEIDNMECEINTVENDKVSSSGSISPDQEVNNIECKQKHMDSDHQTSTYSESVSKGDDENVLQRSDMKHKKCYNNKDVECTSKQEKETRVDSLMEKYPLEKVVLNWLDGGIIMAKLGKLCLSFDPETKFDYMVKPYDEDYGRQRQMISRFKPITELQYVNIDGYEEYVKLLHRKGIEYMIDHKMIDT